MIKDRKTGKCRGFAFVTVPTDEMANELMLAVTSDQYLRQALLKAGKGEAEALSTDERLVLRTWVTYILNLNEVAWKYNQLGLMSDEDMSMRFSELCVSIIEHPTFAKDWAHRKASVLPGFYEAANRSCERSRQGR